MSILYSASAVNPSSDLWLKNSSSLVASYSEVMTGLNGYNSMVSGAKYTVGMVTFPNVLSNVPYLSGWIGVQVLGSPSSFTGTFYLSSIEGYVSASVGTVVTLSAGGNFINLSGLMGFADGSRKIEYLIFVPDTNVPAGIRFVDANPASFSYSAMPTNTFTNVSTKPSLVLLG